MSLDSILFFKRSICISVIRSVLAEGIVSVCFVATLLIVLLSLFVGSSAVIEHRETAIVFFAFCFRLFTFFYQLFVISGYMRSISRSGGLVFFMSLCISRRKLFFSILLGLLITSFVPLFFAVASLMCLSVTGLGILMWCFSLFVEICVTVAISFLSTLLIRRHSLQSVVVSLFYFFCRISNQILDYFLHLVGFDSLFQKCLSYFIRFLIAVIPRFDIVCSNSLLSLSSIHSTDITIFFVAILNCASFLIILLFLSDIAIRRYRV